jgi:hypothetical protein
MLKAIKFYFITPIYISSKTNIFCEIPRSVRPKELSRKYWLLIQLSDSMDATLHSRRNITW